MKKILMVNSVPYGSTAKIMLGIETVSEAKEFEVIVCSGYSYHPLKDFSKSTQIRYIQIGNFVDKFLHMNMSKIFGNHGRYSRIITMMFIHKLKRLSPDIIHFHNIHGWYLNFSMIFDYLKKNNIHVVWTLHDCWAFTGGCAHFIFSKCDKWKYGCGGCNNLMNYPIVSKMDRTKEMFILKRKCFLGIDNMTIVTPSQWLAGLVKQSFLKDYPIKVINNGIDINIFKPTESGFRQKYGIEKKKVILGVSFGWNERKGLDVFIELGERLDESYQIVLVGTDDNTDKKLPKRIISIHRTQDQKELAEIYTAADVFVNPTKEENYPTVHMEALACGTPVITFDTGGASEMLNDRCGIIVTCNDVDQMEKEIRHQCEEQCLSEDECLKQAKRFNEKERYREYFNLYRSLVRK